MGLHAQGLRPQGDQPDTVVPVDVLSPGNDAVADAAGLSTVAVIRKAFVAGAPGLADDVVIYSGNAPFLCRVLDVQVLVSTGIALSTVQLRSAAGGAGSALSDAFPSALTGRTRDTGVGIASVTPTVPQSGTMVLRRSDRGVAGEVIVLLRRE